MLAAMFLDEEHQKAQLQIPKETLTRIPSQSLSCHIILGLQNTREGKTEKDALKFIQT